MSRPSPLRSSHFSSQLAARLLAVAGAAALAAPACSGGGDGASTGTATTTTTKSGTGGAGGAPSTVSSGGSTGALMGFDAGVPEGGLGPPPPGTACLDWPADAGPCPTDPTVILFALDKNGCSDAGGAATQEASSVVSGPTQDTGTTCCYVVNYQWCVAGGRPYLVDDCPQVAPVRRGDRGWSPAREGGSPGLDGLSPEERATLAAAWTADALLEHASVASFARFTLSLLAAGAPAELLRLAQEATLDEVRHAELCFALAGAYAGEAVGPGRFPVGERVEVSGSLASLAAGAVREGCVGETVSALIAAEQHARAVDPAVRAALACIAADEARHAELAWRTVAWALEAGGDEVREAVARAFDEELSRPRQHDEAADAGAALEAHGRLDAGTTERVVRSALSAVVAPAARALSPRRVPRTALEMRAS